MQQVWLAKINRAARYLHTVQFCESFQPHRLVPRLLPAALRDKKTTTAGLAKEFGILVFGPGPLGFFASGTMVRFLTTYRAIVTKVAGGSLF